MAGALRVPLAPLCGAASEIKERPLCQSKLARSAGSRPCTTLMQPVAPASRGNTSVPRVAASVNGTAGVESVEAPSGAGFPDSWAYSET